MTPIRLLLPDRVVDLLEERAAASGRSLESEAAVLLALALRREQAESRAAAFGAVVRDKVRQLAPTE